MKLTKPQNGAKIKHAWFCLCTHSAINLEVLVLYEAQVKYYLHTAIMSEYMAKITQTPTILARTNNIEKRQEMKGGKKESKKDGSKYFCFLVSK